MAEYFFIITVQTFDVINRTYTSSGTFYGDTGPAERYGQLLNHVCNTYGLSLTKTAVLFYYIEKVQ